MKLHEQKSSRYYKRNKRREGVFGFEGEIVLQTHTCDDRGWQFFSTVRKNEIGTEIHVGLNQAMLWSF